MCIRDSAGFGGPPRPVVLVAGQEVQAGAGDGGADRQPGPGRVGLGDLVVGDVVGALGGPVGVEQPDVRGRGQHAGCQLRGELLAGRDQPPEGRQGGAGAALGLLGDPADDGGDEFDDRGRGVRQDVRQASGEGEIGSADHHHRAAGEQGGQHLPDGDVEDQRRGERQPVGAGQPEVLGLGPQVVHHAAVLDQGSLGAPGGSRREDAVPGLQGPVPGGTPGRDGGGAVRIGRVHGGDAELRGRLDGGPAGRSAAPGVARVVEQQGGLAAPEDIGDAQGGPVGGERQIHGAEAFEREEGRDGVGRAVADGGDDGARTAARVGQHRAEPVHAAEEVRVGEGPRTVDDRRAPRSQAGRAGDRLQYAGGGVGTAVPAEAEFAGAVGRTGREGQFGEPLGGVHDAPALWWRSSSWKKPPTGRAEPSAVARRCTYAPTTRSRTPRPNGENTTGRSAGAV